MAVKSPAAPTVAHTSYIPHAFVVEWSADGKAVVAYGAQLKSRQPSGGNQMQILSLNMAMEGFLALHFNGPDTAWPEYSRFAIRNGLGSRHELSIFGCEIPGFDGALRVVEIHHQQVGLLVFVADALASIFVVSHPDDFRQIHTTLLKDFYAELLIFYGLHAAENTVTPECIDSDRVESFEDLR